MTKYVWFSQENKETNMSNYIGANILVFGGVIGLFFSFFVPLNLQIFIAGWSIIFFIMAFTTPSYEGKDTLDRINWKLDQIAGQDKKLIKLFDLKRKMELEENY